MDKRQLTIIINEETGEIMKHIEDYYKKKTGPMISWVMERLCENAGAKIRVLFPEVPMPEVES